MFRAYGSLPASEFTANTGGGGGMSSAAAATTLLGPFDLPADWTADIDASLVGASGYNGDASGSGGAGDGAIGPKPFLQRSISRFDGADYQQQRQHGSVVGTSAAAAATSGGPLRAGFSGPYPDSGGAQRQRQDNQELSSMLLMGGNLFQADSDPLEGRHTHHDGATLAMPWK